jgi:flagellar M-ring protein FliF
MAESRPQQLLLGAKAFWSGLSMGRRVAVTTLGIFLVLALSYIGYVGTSDDYVTAFVDQKPEAASKITAILEAQKIPYELAAGGAVIKVPSDKQHEARLAVAGEGMPGGAVGYELFDEPKFGMSMLEQDMNRRRALQGELRRTVVSLDEVMDARIHVVLPKKATFKVDDEHATASVVLTLAGGRALPKEKIHGIVNLVAAAVEGLDPEHVTVVDTGGNVLAGPTDPTMAASLPMQEFRQNLEKNLERRVLALVEPAVGIGNTRVQISAEVDFAKVEQVDELYDPTKSVVRSEHTLEKRRADQKGDAAGVAGVQANIGGIAPDEGSKSAANLMHSEKTVNHEVPVTRRKTEESVGKTKRLAVAVLVNGTYLETEGAEGKVEREYKERTEEELAKLESIVKAAVGYDEERGDQVIVRNMPFVEAPIAATDAGFMLSPDAWRGVRYGFALLLALLLMLFLVRPIVKSVTAHAPQIEDAEPVLAIEEPAELPDIAMGSAEPALSPRVIALDFATQEPRKTAKILRAWLLEDGRDVAAVADLSAEAQRKVKERAERT